MDQGWVFTNDSKYIATCDTDHQNTNTKVLWNLLKVIWYLTDVGNFDISNAYLISKLLEIFFVEQNEPEQRSRHGPLVSTIFKHDNVEYCGQHLLQDFRMDLDHLDQGVVLQVGLLHSAASHFSCKIKATNFKK